VECVAVVVAWLAGADEGQLAPEHEGEGASCDDRDVSGEDRRLLNACQLEAAGGGRALLIIYAREDSLPNTDVRGASFSARV
jgi:hypothetical protein